MQHLHLRLQSRFFLSCFPIYILKAFLISSMRTADGTHLILLNLTATVLLGEEK
jgi:hypothetical protein